MTTIYSPVFRDPKGKFMDGVKTREHCYTIKTDNQVLIRRFRDKETAEQDRKEMLGES